MNDIFGEISSDFLPEGFGEVESKTVQRVGVPQPPDGDHIPPGYGDPEVAAASNLGPTPTRMSSPEVRSYSNPAPVAQKTRGDIEREMFFGNLGAFGVARNNSGATSRLVGPDKDGYTWEQFADGHIVLRGSKSGKGIGTSYAAGSPAANAVALASGPYSAGSGSAAGTGTGTGKKASKQTAVAVGAGVGAFFNQVVPSLAAMLSPQAAIDPNLELPVDTGATESTTPWGLILGVTGAVAVVGGIFYFMSRPSHNSED